MKKVIALSTVLIIGALGMACGEAASNMAVKELPKSNDPCVVTENVNSEKLNERVAYYYRNNFDMQILKADTWTYTIIATCKK